MKREEKTVEAMIRLYCRQHHSKLKLCHDCGQLSAYARERLRKCPFQEGKTVCIKCKVHCYKPEMREQIRTVMRYSGPRMIYLHPVMAVFHLIDRRRKEPTSVK
jgi:hypothetical protein